MFKKSTADRFHSLFNSLFYNFSKSFIILYDLDLKD